MNCECNNNSNRIEPRIKHVYGNVLRMAIPLTLRTLVKDGDEMIVNDTDFIPSSDHLVRVVFSKGKTNYPVIATMDGNVAIIEDRGKIPVGTYDISVECYDDLGNPYRFKQNAVLYVTDTTAEAGIDEEIEYEAQTWYLNAAVFLATTEIGEIGDVIDAKLDDVFGNAVYDANAKEIRFYNKDNSRVLASIDATPFTADGSVEDVYIDVGRQVLVVVNNDAAGGTRFSVPLYLVFAEYYKKDEVDSLVSRTVENVRLDFSQELPLVVPVTKNGSSISSSIDYGTIDNAIHEDGRLVVACVNNAKFYQLSGVNGMEVVFSRVTALDGYQELLIVNESNVWSMEDVDLGTGGGGGGYEPPVGGIPKTDLAQSVQDTLDSVADKVDKEQGKGLSSNDYTDADKEKVGDLPTKAELDESLANAGKVKSVTVNGTNYTPDSNGNVDLGTIQGAKGDKGDKGDTVVINPEGLVQFEIANDLDTSDPTQGLSARQGKILKQAISTVQANLQAVVDALANMAFTSAKPTLSQIDWTGGTFYATVVKNLSGCTATDNTTNGQIAEGSTLTVTLSASSGYTLDGATISVTNSKGQSVAYTLSNNVMTISNVVGTINISVTAIGVFSVTNSDTHVDLTSQNMSPTTGSSWSGTLAIKSSVSGYGLAATPNVTMGGSTVDFSASGNSWNQSTGAMTIGSVTGDIVIVSASSEVVAHAVNLHLLNMTSSNNATMVEDGQSYTADITVDSSCTSNDDLRVVIDGVDTTTNCTITSITGGKRLVIPAAAITGDIHIAASASTGKVTVKAVSSGDVTVKISDTNGNGLQSYTVTAGESLEITPNKTGRIVFDPKTNVEEIDYGGVLFTNSYYASLDGCSGVKRATGIVRNSSISCNGTSAMEYIDVSHIKPYCSLFKNMGSGLVDAFTVVDGMTAMNTSEKTSFEGFFQGSRIQEVVINNMSAATSMKSMFSGSKVRRVILRKGASGVTTWYDAFSSCANIEYIDISELNITSALTEISFAFNGAKSGITMKIGGFDMSGVTSSTVHGMNRITTLICTTSAPQNSALLTYMTGLTDIYVPNDAVYAYKEAWASKESNIHPVSEYTE